MKEKHPYYVVRAEVLPEVFLKVVEVKSMLEKDRLLTVQEATERAGISRSSFYKYKDAISPFYDKGTSEAITVLIHLQDETGRLSDVLNYIASVGGNVLTINQMVPMNAIAIINLCIQIRSMSVAIDELISGIQSLAGVNEIQVLAKE